MSPQEARAFLSPTHRRALRTAFLILERPDFAARISEAAGKPVHRALRMTPRSIETPLARAIEAALTRALDPAIRSVVDAPGREAGSFALAGASGAIIEAIAPRFGVVVSERAAASGLAVLGAIGGAALNTLFVRHFQRTAHGRFTIRRLERLSGPKLVGADYRGLVLKAPRAIGPRR